MQSNVRRISYVIPKNFTGKYLKDFLISIGYSNDLIKYLKQTVNLDAFHLLSYNEKITIDIIETEKSDNIIPNPLLPIDILYEDEDILIVNKPANMPTHPSQGNYENTLANAVVNYMNSESFVYRPITRLDKDTSGVLLIAKNRLSASVLSTMIKNNVLKRSYIGIVSGNIYEILTPHRSLNIDGISNAVHVDAIIDIPIKREDDSTIKRTISPDGENAITKIVALKYYKDKNISLCKFNLLTGRTHQIRVHMSHIGFPIIGDFLYNPDFRYINRQALHSNEIILLHPTNYKLLRIKSKMPDDFKKII